MKRLFRKQYTFNNFLSGVPSRNYTFQEEAYSSQIQRAVQMIQEADSILVGIGAGMSTAAGAEYGGKFFEDNFKEFIDIYGDNPYMHDMYSAGFYPYPSQEAKWGYWSKQAILGGMDLDVTELYKTFMKVLEGKPSFILSTNADGQFEKAGYPKENIFNTQGDYFHIQCKKACHNQIYDATKLFRQMDQARKQAVIPSYMVPKCPVCGGNMEMNLRCDNYFVQDDYWYQQEQKFSDFLSENIDKKLLLIELGVGFNTPTIIRFPFDKLVLENKNINLIRLNLNEAIIPSNLDNQIVGINRDMKESIEDIVHLYTKDE